MELLRYAVLKTGIFLFSGVPPFLYQHWFMGMASAQISGLVTEILSQVILTIYSISFNKL